jgi:hypothetical protein
MSAPNEPRKAAWMGTKRIRTQELLLEKQILVARRLQQEVRREKEHLEEEKRLRRLRRQHSEESHSYKGRSLLCSWNRNLGFPLNLPAWEEGFERTSPKASEQFDQLLRELGQAIADLSNLYFFGQSTNSHIRVPLDVQIERAQAEVRALRDRLERGASKTVSPSSILLTEEQVSKNCGAAVQKACDKVEFFTEITRKKVAQAKHIAREKKWQPSIAYPLGSDHDIGQDLGLNSAMKAEILEAVRDVDQETTNQLLAVLARFPSKKRKYAVVAVCGLPAEFLVMLVEVMHSVEDAELVRIVSLLQVHGLQHGNHRRVATIKLLSGNHDIDRLIKDREERKRGGVGGCCWKGGVLGANKPKLDTNSSPKSPPVPAPAYRCVGELFVPTAKDVGTPPEYSCTVCHCSHYDFLRAVSPEQVNGAIITALERSTNGKLTQKEVPRAIRTLVSLTRLQTAAHLKVLVNKGILKTQTNGSGVLSYALGRPGQLGTRRG